MMTKQTLQRLPVAGLLTTSLLVGFASAAPASADAHALQAWKCKYLMRHAAPDGQRYAWRIRCERFRTAHAKYHRHGIYWICYEQTGNARTTCIIRKVWGGGWRGEEAVRVARCESGFRTHARNGQYRGIFQMGSGERARWGHGSTVMAQAKAAHRYYSYAGGWGPWACKP